MTSSIKKYRKDLDNGSVVIVRLRYDDECKNGHNTFAITADYYGDSIRNYHEPFVVHSKTNHKVFLSSCGCQHDLIREHFPELRNYIKWHLTSTDGPMHYIENTIYWAKEGNLPYARDTAVWPDASLEQLSDRKALEDRLPTLLLEFRKDIESLGFVF